MRNWLCFFSVLLLTTACDDGDVLNIQLDFDKELSLCEIQTANQGSAITSSFLFYDTREDPFESLTLLIPRTTITEAMFNPTTSGDEQTITIDGTIVQFHYRSYNGDPNALICAVIPPAGVSVTNSYSSSSGTAKFVSTFQDDDNDGVPTALEFDGDSDGDGIPNYKDNDDDGDNVADDHDEDARRRREGGVGLGFGPRGVVARGAASLNMVEEDAGGAGGGRRCHSQRLYDAHDGPRPPESHLLLQIL